MFPLKDENPTLHKSVITFIVIILNILSWILIQGLGRDPALAESVCRFGVIPGDLLGLIKSGSYAVGPGMSCSIDGRPDWYTVVTSMFMHGGWFHIIGNMWFLGVFGDNIEDVMGPFRFLMFYLLCGISAVAAQVIAAPASPVPMIGASGAISGVMGAYAVLFPRAPVHMLVFFGFFFTRIVVPAFLVLGYWILLQFLGGFMSGGEGGGVAFWAHIGGFVSGIILVYFFCKSGRLEECRARRGRTERFLRKY